jgi:hypothetical protein
MAGGHVYRANRPNTWLHRPTPHDKAHRTRGRDPEPIRCGTSRHSAFNRPDYVWFASRFRAMHITLRLPNLDRWAEGKR